VRRVLVAALLLLASTRAFAASAEPDGRAGDAFDIMNLLARHGLHNLDDEHWNAYGQFTWISSFKLPFDAKYTNLGGSNHSLRPGFEHSYTGTVTAYFGVKLWRGFEAYWVPEVIILHPLSNLAGLGGAIQNFELQKTGSALPTYYNSRFYFRQSFDLGGYTVHKSSDPMQVQQVVKSRRFVITFGNFSILDFMDKNSFAGDLRRQFFNMAFLTYAAYDFAADARGYTWGAEAELVLDDWTLRFAHTIEPKDPNQLPLDGRFWKYYGQQVELEHVHSIRGHTGAVRILGYRNHVNSARFADAIADLRKGETAGTCGDRFNYGSTNGTAPDLCWARQPNVKWGIGVNIEQELRHHLGIFLRGMYSDGNSEVFSFGSADRSLSLGILARGGLWRRRNDYAGIGYGVSWISSVHARYLALGGVDGFVGDGALRQTAEGVFEAFYGVNLGSSTWLSADYQIIHGPGYNADRGPVSILGARFHAEF